MGEAKRRREQMKIDLSKQIILPVRKCSAGRDAKYCCEEDAWEKVMAIGMYGAGFMFYGEPLPQEVIEFAPLYQIDPHDLDWHVGVVHGFEPHDQGYLRAVNVAGACLQDAGYDIVSNRDKETCRS